MNIQKDDRWSVLKGALLISVVVGHFCQLYLDRELRGGGIIQSLLCLIYSFHMPLFVFISGYFSKNLEKRRNTAFSGLLIPFIVGQVVLGSITLVTDENLNLFRNPLYATYGTWYLISLFIWRTLMPDLIRIKKLSVLAVIMFFTTPLFWGMDNTLGLQRTLGFFCFFLAGYDCNEQGVFRILKVPRTICVGIFLVEIIVLFICFDILSIPHSPVFIIFTHGLTISKELWKAPFIMVGYAAAFALAVFNSVLFMNLFFRGAGSKFKKALAKIGEDTMPLYLSHLVLVKIFAAVMKGLPDAVYLTLSILVGTAVVFGLSSKGYRKLFNRKMKKIESLLLLPRHDSINNVTVHEK